MTDDEQSCLNFLRKLKVQKKAIERFEETVDILQQYADSKGLEDKVINMLAKIISDIDLGASKMICLVKCLIPRYKVPEETFHLITSWYLSSVDKLPITLSIAITQWIIGLWDYHLIDRKVINIYYNVFFYIMLKKESLGKHIARLIYVLTKPEDVTRRDVCRLLVLRQKYAQPKPHITVLLSLFKSYRPELVPEKIQSVNVESVWKPIPQDLQSMLQNAKVRLEVQEDEVDEKCFKWATNEFGKRKSTMPPLLPSVGYFQIGSSIFEEKDTTSIFDISNIEELGKSHLSVELPCNAISLLVNTAGYHLLTFANFQYQSRFSYNLYNTLVTALILENEKFSVVEINKLLNMTIEFSRYMQQGIPVINRFLDEYLSFNTAEYQSQLLSLVQWMTSISINDLQEKILVHVQNMFYESTLTTKCEIIKTLKILITNLFVAQGFEECYYTTSAPFLGQSQVNNLEDVIPILTKVSQDLIISGLNIHSYNNLLLAEALSFYEEICILESRSNILSFTLAPSAIIYGSFITKNCAFLSKICRLLLRYHSRILQLKDHKLQNLLEEKMYIVSIYAKDIAGALLYEQPFKRSCSFFSQIMSDKTLKDLNGCDSYRYLNISNHYSILPYKCVLRKAGLDISSKEDAMSLALHYYPVVNEFLTIFQS